MDMIESLDELLERITDATDTTSPHRHFETLESATLDALYDPQELDRETRISAGTWNAIAWAGATRGQAREVSFAVERAIKLEPGNINYLDTRGLIRALTGDTAGAIEDFKAFVAGARNYPQNMVKQRHLWLAALVLGKNPFTDEVLAALRQE